MITTDRVQKKQISKPYLSVLIGKGVKQVFCCVFDAQNLLDCRFNRNTIIPAQFVISEKENFYNLSFR